LRTIARLSNNVPGVNQKGEAKIDWSDLKLSDDVNAQVAKSLNENGKESIHTFNILALAKIGQHSNLFDKTIAYGKSLQWWAFLLLFIGFAVKVPAVRCIPGCQMHTSKRRRPSP